MDEDYPVQLNQKCEVVINDFHIFTNVMNKCIIMIENYILVFVLFEWIFADYIITTQKHRKVEEILF